MTPCVFVDIAGHRVTGGGTARSKPSSVPWMSAKAWDQLLAYEATLGTAFAGLPSAVEASPGDWKVSTRPKATFFFAVGF